jgi:predicted amidohydrolase YtcJ
MAADLILTARSIITMEPDAPRATAVAINGADGTIAAVGDLDSCRKALPSAPVQDLGDVVLMPGFIESHSHPVLSGMMTQKPAHWIAPYVGFPIWADVVTEFKRVDKETPAGEALIFNGLDRLLHGCEAPTAAVLDAIFGEREAIVADNSGHAAYCTTSALKSLGWIENPPADPVGGSYGRNPDGSINGQAFELSAVMSMAAPFMARVVKNPLASAAEWYALMARNGITSTSEMTYDDSQKAAFVGLAMQPSCPLRISLYHMSTDDKCGEKFESPIPLAMLQKKGIKLWADGSPWVGNVALTFPYLDTAATRLAGIEPGVPGIEEMNYTRDQLDEIIDKYAPTGFQFAFHCNGDAALDVVLDAYEAALKKFDLLGTDHRWRLEHLGAARTDQFVRAASLGVYASMGPFQFQYWGDLLDGEMFDHEHGSQWCRVKDATDAGLRPSYHNDGAVTPPSPVMNIKTVTTRSTNSGTVRGEGQKVSLDQALRAQTIDAAFILGREDEIGSIKVGKLADFVELSADPYTLDPMKLATDLGINGTWLSGSRIDLDAFLVGSGAEPAEDHNHLTVPRKRCC